MKIEHLRMYPFSTTLMGVLKGVLDYYGIKTSDALAFGGSGHAFLINIHEQICPSGPYCWNYDTFYELVQKLGVEMTDLGFFHAGSSPDEKSRVEGKLKEYLDGGLPCSFCNMENQVIYGYARDKFLLARPWPKPMEITPATLTMGAWEEFGKEVHVNFFVFKKLAKKDDATIIRDSLRYAVELFRNPEKHSQAHYGIGPRAYDNWARAVEAGHGSSHGNWWNATVWSECRKMASRYFLEISGKTKGDVRAQANELGRNYKQISELLEKIGSKEMAAAEKVRIVGELKQQELNAVRRIEEFLKVFNG
jgi:hypothetical protein